MLTFAVGLKYEMGILIKYVISLVLTTISLLPATQSNHVSVTCVDCHLLRLTSRHSTSLVNCSSTNLPYCDPSTSSCSAAPPPRCVNPDNFTCASDGYFPDPWDCQGFHLCVELAPTKYFCDSGTPSSYNFDVVLHRCTPTARCGYKCSGKSGVKVAHPDDPNLFAYCFNGSVVLQDRCPGNYELNEATEKCEAVCHTNGILVDVEDCTKYYRCIYQNSGYYRSHETCPDGQGFNALTLQCEEHSLHCKATVSDELITLDSVGDEHLFNETTIDESF